MDIENVYTCELCKSDMKTIKMLKVHMMLHMEATNILTDPNGTIMLSDPSKNKVNNFLCVFCRDAISLDVSMFKNHMETGHNMFYEHDILLAINFIGEEDKVSISEKVVLSNKIQLKSNEQIKAKRNINLNLFHNQDIVEGIDNINQMFSCQYCSKTFKRRCRLRRHTYIHTKEKPYTCTKCSRSFSQREHLKTHMTIHTGEKPHSCPHCNKSFSQRSTRNSHIYTHGGEKPFRCEQCLKFFTTSSNFKRHMLGHTGK